MSPKKPPPPKVAVLVSHGQPSAPPPAELHLAYIAAQVSDHLPGWDVRSATLSGKGTLDQAMADGAVIFPFFMARGYFTARVLPKRLEGRAYAMASPFGLLRDLPAQTAQLLQKQFAAGPWPEAPPQLLLAAHGSARGPKAAEAAEGFAARLRASLPDVEIRTGYVEQAPFIDGAAAALGPNSLCLPFFAQSGEHVREDIPEALTKAGFKGRVLPSLGAADFAPRLIAQAIAAAHDTGSDDTGSHDDAPTDTNDHGTSAQTRSAL